MAQIIQAPAELDVVGVQGQALLFTVLCRARDGSGNPISGAFSDTSIDAVVRGLGPYSDRLQEVDVIAPEIGGGATDGGDTYTFTVEWTAEISALFAQYKTVSWAVSFSTVDGSDGPLPGFAGTVQMLDPTTPGASVTTDTELTVVVSNMTVDLAVTIGGAGGGTTLKDPGFIAVYPSGGIEIDTPAVFIAPQQDGDGFSSSQPFEGSDWRPLQVIGAGEIFGAFIDSDLTSDADAFDTVDVSGEIVVWDQAGANVLVAAFSMSGINSGTGSDVSIKVTLIQVVGSDLSVVDPGLIQSAAGGSYNILITAGASWD